MRLNSMTVVSRREKKKPLVYHEEHSNTTKKIETKRDETEKLYRQEKRKEQGS